MKVLHISGARSWGGNEQQLLYLVEELQKYPVSQKLFCFKDSPLMERMKENSIEIFAMNAVSAFSSEYHRSLKNTVKEQAIDIIHLHTSDAVTGFVITDLLYSLKTPTLFAKKGIRSKMSFLSKQKYNYKGIDKILCISHYVKRHFQKELYSRNQDKLEIVYNGVKLQEKRSAAFRLREKLDIANNHLLIGNIANHTAAKDLPTMLKMVDHLANTLEVRDFHIVQIGKPSKLTRQLESDVKQLGLEKYITFMGFVKDASSFLPQFDMFVMSSEREGGPSSIVEAFANRTPVLSTKVGVVEEVIKDGENGFVVEVGDYREMANKVKEFRDHPELSEQFAEKSYKIFLQKFSVEQLGRNTFNIYESLVQQKNN